MYNIIKSILTTAFINIFNPCIFNQQFSLHNACHYQW